MGNVFSRLQATSLKKQGNLKEQERGARLLARLASCALPLGAFHACVAPGFWPGIFPPPYIEGISLQP